ncbi:MULTISPECIES: flagellar brake protein [unclassified Bacillus (in: firmicutes)]|uniref:flagellar brake protein n=1 Tax=unclassified Bacillus (in: firmicutes) TaxID=185979 RepID=UPI0008F2CAB2|nr:MULTISPECIES: flagellar brake domain-containing protein [unclassified Bacillus (in: firmicutes)]SFA98265.1 c-di-GMP-binding flagellar brake protein YcgR, contains PilZNR and PilZ domains [Bacillus sp. UNCCL13]SFQ80927.1 c-di-GMP-binding flagellar brake protein YcgR, contains PilZNR and PilZ domains [Bacillus sp. cl95]
MINIGDVLTLEPKNSDQFEKYKTKMVERKGNDLYIDYPINLKTNKTVFLLDGTQLKVSFVGKDGSIYLFEAEIKGRVKQNIPMLVLSFPGIEHLIKIQRRQYVRVETAIDIAIHPLNLEFEPFTAITDDISAGGAAIIFPKETPLKAGMTVNSWYVLPMQNGEYHYIKVQCKVVRIIPFSDIKSKASLEFIDISGYERQLVLRLSFERQLANRNKGL